MLREALYIGRKKYKRLRGQGRESAVHDLFAWLDEQTPAPLPEQFVAAWESNFQQKQAVRACVGAGFSLGFRPDDVRSLVRAAFQRHRSGEDL
jgi:hypothetical protein